MEELQNKLNRIDMSRLPRHVAIIMDGNGRWAKLRGEDRCMGHVEGVNSVRKATELSSDLGIDYLTLYAFSTENWNRPQQEVDALMHLIGMAIERETPDLIKNNVHLNLIGALDRMPKEAYDRLRRCELATAHCTGLTMTLALSYSSRWEIVEAVKKIATSVKSGEINESEIDDNLFAQYLATSDMPDPDLLIRPSGELRVSNFLLWQIAYSEFWITNVLWPDFGKEHLWQAIWEYQNRDRRYGGLGK